MSTVSTPQKELLMPFLVQFTESSNISTTNHQEMQYLYNSLLPESGIVAAVEHLSPIGSITKQFASSKALLAPKPTRFRPNLVLKPTT